MMLKNTWAILDPSERKQFIGLAAWSIFISLADILALAALLWVINFYMQGEAAAGVKFLPAWLADRDSVLLITVYFILFTLKNISGYLLAKADFSFSGRVALRLSRQNLARFQQAPFEEFIQTDSSVLISRIALQPFDFSLQVLSGIQQILTQFLLVSLAIIAILIFNARLFFLLLIILLPPVVIVFYFIKKKLGSTKRQLQESNELSYQYMLDALKGWVEGNIYQRNDFFAQRFIRHRGRFSDSLFRSLSLQSLPGRIIEIFAVLGLFFLVLLAKWPGNPDRQILITIGAFMAAAYKIIPGIVKIINLSGQMKAYEPAVEGLLKQQQREIRKQEMEAVPIRSVDLQHIYFSFGGKKVLEDFSLQIKQGDIVGICGPSGIGKTTVLNLLLGFLGPEQGRVLINELPVIPGQLEHYWPSIAYVRQQSFFIYDTVLKNITLDEKEEDPVRLADSLEATGLDNLVAAWPEGLEKKITENGKNISGGQQQRIALTRAFYKNADLLLLDEPFNELDEASTDQILKRLKEKAASGKLVVLVTHDKKSLSICNKIISLDEP